MLEWIVGLLVLLYFLFQLLWRLYVGLELLWFGINLLYVLLLRLQKKGDLQKMNAFPKGVLYEAKNKSSDDAFRPIAALLAFWEQPQAKEFPCLVGHCMHEQIKRSKKNMQQHAVYRKLRFAHVTVESRKGGKIYRVWNNGDKEWRYCRLKSAVLEQYCAAGTHKVLKETYSPEVSITYLMSRRLSPDDQKRARSIDKWGRIREIQSFYQDRGLTNCPSCGAELPQDKKDIVCPYCDSTVFADFYDWQVELLEINRNVSHFSCLTYLVWKLFASRPVSTLVDGSRKDEKKKKNRIVRFSENDFLCNVYEDLFAHMPEENFIDLNVGELQVQKVRNTEEDSYVTLNIPVEKTYFAKDGSIVAEKGKEKRTYRRKRYPNRFRPEDAVVSAEKECPACGGAFSPDEQGNCRFCGSFLLLDHRRWFRDTP